MKKIMLHTINGKKIKKIVMITLCCGLMVNVIGCTHKNRERYLEKSVKANKEQADAVIQSILNALDSQDSKIMKDLFSTYALEHAEDLDERIEELMEFYPGCNGGFEGSYNTHESNDYGVKTWVLNGTYTISMDTKEYQIRFTTQLRNDKEPEKIGLYLIEVMTEDAKPEGFKWKSEKDAPGIYILE